MYTVCLQWLVQRRGDQPLSVINLFIISALHQLWRSYTGLNYNVGLGDKIIQSLISYSVSATVSVSWQHQEEEGLSLIMANLIIFFAQYKFLKSQKCLNN